MGIGGGSAHDVEPRKAPGHERRIRPQVLPESRGQGWWKTPGKAREEWFQRWAKRNGVVLAGVVAVAGLLLALAWNAKVRHDERRVQELLAEIERRAADPNYTTPDGVTVNAFRDHIARPHQVLGARTSSSDDDLEGFFGDAVEGISLDDALAEIDRFAVCNP